MVIKQLQKAIFVERYLFCKDLRNASRIQDTSEMLNFINYLKSNVLIENYILVSFDMKSIFRRIDNQSGLQAVKNALETRQEQFPPTNCIIESALFLIISIFFRSMVLPDFVLCLVQTVTLTLKTEYQSTTL